MPLSKPNISPIPFGHNPTYKTDIVLPARFVGNRHGGRYKSTLRVTGNWGVVTLI